MGKLSRDRGILRVGKNYVQRSSWGRVRVPRLGPGRPRTRPGRACADKAYASHESRACLGQTRLSL